jgi:TonB family protein
MPDWKQCEGELANGEFPLERYLGGTQTRAVFLTRFALGRAAIKLEHADLVQAGELVVRWNRAGGLHHRHLAAIHAAGTWVLAGTPVAYLVTEYAEENLAEVLRSRPLTRDETREMLLPVADALAYLHRQGLVHGDLKASNILAVGETVKISSEAVSTGDPAADIRALGITLVQALTQRAATLTPVGRDPAVDSLPFPFRVMAENCLHNDPHLRWSADRIAAWLRSPEQAAPPISASAETGAKPATGKPRLRYYVAAASLVVVAAVVGGVVMHRMPGPVPSDEPVRPTPALPPPGPPPGPTAAPVTIPPVPSGRDAVPLRGNLTAEDGIKRRVLPDIPAKARDTVRGKPAVIVRVTVDSAGHVTETILERSGSPYFGKLALEAARQWQFAPEPNASQRNWILRFEITRTSTRVIARRTGRE